MTDGAPEGVGVERELTDDQDGRLRIAAERHIIQDSRPPESFGLAIRLATAGIGRCATPTSATTNPALQHGSPAPDHPPPSTPHRRR